MSDINELRRLTQAATPGPWHATKSVETNSWAVWSYTTRLMELRPTKTVDMYRVSNTAAFIAAANPATISELLDRLEAAESDGLEQARLLGMSGEREAALLARLEAAEKERDEFKRACFGHISDNSMLRAKIAEMERQEPVGKIVAFGESLHEPSWREGRLPPLMTELYTLPGAQPAPSGPNLDMDALERKNDALKEEVGKLRDALALIADQYEPKCSLLIPSIARSALCATGAYGQTEAQPTLSVPPELEPNGIYDSSHHYASGWNDCRAAMLEAQPEAKP